MASCDSLVRGVHLYESPLLCRFMWLQPAHFSGAHDGLGSGVGAASGWASGMLWDQLSDRNHDLANHDMEAKCKGKRKLLVLGMSQVSITYP